MSDVRNPEDLVSAVIDLQAKLADLESTLMVRVARRPTGDIEPTLRSTPKPNAIFMTGQVVFRSTYPVLYQFAEDNGLFATGLFGPGDGSTTFGIPNFTGRTIIGAGAVAVGTEVGADIKLITIANLPVHSHNYAAANGYADYAGGHGGHISTGWTMSNGTGPSRTLADVDGSSVGDHWHEVVNGNQGQGVGFDVRQASKVINWMIYT